MEHSVSTVMCSVLLKYIQKKGGTPRSFLKDLPPEETLMSDSESVPLHVFHTLLTRVSDEFSEENAPFAAGTLLVAEHLRRSFEPLHRFISSPLKYYRKTLPGFLKSLSSFRDFEVTVISPTQIEMADKNTTGAEIIPESCEFYRGILSSIPILWELDTAEVRHISCRITIDRVHRPFGRSFRIDKYGNIIESRINKKTSSLYEKMIGKINRDGTFTLEGTVHGEAQCVYHIEWKKKKHASYSLSNLLSGKQRNLEESLEKLEEERNALLMKNEELSSINRQLQDGIAERTEALQESEEQYKILIESSPMGIVIYQKDRFHFINSRFTKMLGYSVKDLLALSLVDLLEDYDYYLVTKVLREAREKKEMSEMLEMAFIKADGHRIFCNVTVIPVKLRDEDAIQLIFKDVTDKKELEKQLHLSQKIETLGTMVSGIAHDFNNILGGLLGYLSFMKSNITRDDEDFEILDIMEKTALRGSSLTRQLLSFSTRDSQVFRPLNPGNLIEETTRILERTLEKNITFNIAISPHIPLIDGDRSQLEQVFMNLCVNARDAMPLGGTIEIQAFPKRMDEENRFTHSMPPGLYSVITVSDTGVGMSEETIKRIFEPFFTTKGRGKGTGLGLAIVYNVIKSHSGFIEVISATDRGTVFTLYFPASAVQKEKSSEGSRELKKGTGRVLVIDDEEIIRKVSGSMLEKLGYEAVVASTGREAMEIFGRRHGAFDLLIIDLTITDISSKELVQHFTSSGRKVKVVISSGSSDSEDIALYQKLGAGSFLQKPYTIEDFSHCIYDTLHDEPMKGTDDESSDLSD